MDVKLIQDMKDYLSFSLFEKITNELSESQRRKIDWYLLKLATKCGKRKDYEQMHLMIAKFHREELQKFDIKSIYAENESYIKINSFVEKWYKAGITPDYQLSNKAQNEKNQMKKELIDLYKNI